MGLFPEKPPPGPTQPEWWQSPLRGPFVTSVFGAVLLIGIPVIALTGFLSQVAYNPELGRNNIIGDVGILDFFVFTWPTSPSWLYAVTQGIHVTLGITLVPILLAKLWSVIPKLFKWPPVKGPFDVLERISLLLLVGGIIFEFATGIINIQLWYEPLNFGFVRAHFIGAWVFLSAFVLHLVLKVPTMARNLRARRDVVDEADAEGGSLVAVRPMRATMQRRDLFAIVGGSSLALFVLTAGQSIGGFMRALALLAPHGQDPPGDGPNAFQINKTAQSVGVDRSQTGPEWRLEVVGPGGRETFTRAQLAQMRLYTETLPIACVEGWSTTQDWTGVRLRDLGEMVGGLDNEELFIESLQKSGSFATTTFANNQFSDERSLLALRVGGADLSLDHGYPARVIAPAVPGVHNTKWVTKLTFRA